MLHAVIFAPGHLLVDPFYIPLAGLKQPFDIFLGKLQFVMRFCFENILTISSILIKPVFIGW
jgi:hypothetical protein